MHVAYKSVHSTNTFNKACFSKEQGSNECQSIYGKINNDNMITENRLESSISDISMDDDVTYMDYSLNNCDPTNDIPHINDDVIMESYVL